jgi:ApaG protein
MYKATTHDIQVSVVADYVEPASRPDENQYVFRYKINIINHSDTTVKLLRRHWYIIDSNGKHNEVEGEGVVGNQPVIGPAQQHEYVSGCSLATEMGKMYGTYLMERQSDGTTFKIEIPEFVMIAGYRLN